jgi:hypothetical protein
VNGGPWKWAGLKDDHSPDIHTTSLRLGSPRLVGGTQFSDSTLCLCCALLLPLSVTAPKAIVTVMSTNSNKHALPNVAAHCQYLKQIAVAAIFSENRTDREEGIERGSCVSFHQAAQAKLSLTKCCFKQAKHFWDYNGRCSNFIRFLLYTDIYLRNGVAG